MCIKRLLILKRKHCYNQLFEYELRQSIQDRMKEITEDYKSGAPTGVYNPTELELLARHREAADKVIELKRRRSYKKRDLLLHWLLPLIYRRGAKKPIRGKTALFANDRYTSLPDNMVPVRDELERRGFKCIYVLKPENMPLKGIIKQARSFFLWLRFTRLYSRTQLVFVTDYFMPLYANYPRKETRVVQLWHACGAFKKWGYSTVDANWGPNRESLERYPIHNTYTDAFCSSEKVAPCYAKAYNCPIGSVHAVGVPRTDIFFDKEKVAAGRAALEELCPGAKGKKVILYAPTYRGNNIRHCYLDCMLDFTKLYDELGDEYCFIVKLHPLIKKRFVLPDAYTQAGFLYDITDTMGADQSLMAADIFITDYSSMVFEYSLLERPMLFFAFDLEQYVDDRGFYFKYEDFVPGPIVRDTDQIISIIKDDETHFDADRVRAFKHDYMGGCDGSCTKKAVDFLLDPATRYNRKEEKN